MNDVQDGFFNIFGGFLDLPCGSLGFQEKFLKIHVALFLDGIVRHIEGQTSRRRPQPSLGKDLAPHRVGKNSKPANRANKHTSKNYPQSKVFLYIFGVFLPYVASEAVFLSSRGTKISPSLLYHSGLLPLVLPSTDLVSCHTSSC